MKPKSTIIPIASGKGGVGKSIFSANLAIAIANLGYKTIAVDLDLGGSNLHTYLGFSNDYAGIGDYLKSKSLKFENLIIKTDIPNLSFIPGDGRTPFMANIPFDQRMELLNALSSIESQFVILDLGAGSTFNTLNFFGMSHRGMIMTTFEAPAQMNFLTFLRNFVFRIISSVVRHERRIFNMVVDEFRRPMSKDPLTVQVLIEKIAEHNNDLAETAKKACGFYQPRIVFNMGDTPQDLQVIPKIENTIKETLSLNSEFFGYIFYDELVREATRRKVAFLPNYPKSMAALSIDNIARRIVKIWNQHIDQSGARLYKDTIKKYKLWKDI